MRILFVSDDHCDIRVGAVKAPLRLAEALRSRGHRCDFIFHNDVGGWPRSERLRLALSPWLARRAVIRAWRRSVAEGAPYDLIEAAGAEGFALGLLRKVSCYRTARLIVRSHGMDAFWFDTQRADHRAGYIRKPWYRRILFPLTRLTQEAGAMRLGDGVIVSNLLGANRVLERKWQPPTRVHVIPHGVRRERWLEAPTSGAARGAGILFSGYWQPVKGTHYLAEAFRQLLATGIRVNLTLLSPMESPESPDQLQEEVARIKNDFDPICWPHLSIIPRTPNQDEVFRLYRTHDVLVCPSNFEGFGLVVVEAMSQRLPVVCTSAVGATNFFRAGEEAIVVPPRDAGALATALARLLDDHDLRVRLGEAGHRLAGELSWEATAEATLWAYEGKEARNQPN